MTDSTVTAATCMKPLRYRTAAASTIMANACTKLPVAPALSVTYLLPVTSTAAATTHKTAEIQR